MEPTPNITVRTSAPTEQLLTFIVANEEYGVDILRVQEIRGWSRPMAFPHAPPYVKGVINIRGDIVPICDMRERLGLTAMENTPTTVIVVVRVEHEGRSRTVGFVVDAMSDVTDVAGDAVRPPPDLGRGNGAAALARGIALVGDHMITILDIDAVFPLPSSSADAA